MKFGVFTDLHYETTPDGDRRMAELLCRFRAAHVDFAVELGDLCHPTPENQKLLRLFEEAGIPCLFSVGNHTTDFCPQQAVLDFFGLNRGYYAVTKENVKFIFLDANYRKTAVGYVPEDRGTPRNNTDEYPYIPPEQLAWLKEELADDRLYYIIATHQSLANDFQKGHYTRGIANRADVQALLEERNANGRKILFCMNGHDHGDSIATINGISYYSLNSASYIWHGLKEVYSYSPEIHRQYPHIKDMILYEEALCVIVTIDEQMNVQIEGMEGHYQATTPEQVGMGDMWNGVSTRPRTSSLFIPFGPPPML